MKKTVLMFILPVTVALLFVQCTLDNVADQNIAPPAEAVSCTTLDSAGSVGYFTSIAVDSNDRFHISYFDSANGDLKYAHSN